MLHVADMVWRVQTDSPTLTPFYYDSKNGSCYERQPKTVTGAHDNTGKIQPTFMPYENALHLRLRTLANSKTDETFASV